MNDAAIMVEEAFTFSQIHTQENMEQKYPNHFPNAQYGRSELEEFAPTDTSFEAGLRITHLTNLY